MYISVDVGYSQVKAVADSGQRVQFPSVVAPARLDPVQGFAKKPTDYWVSVRGSEGYEEKLIGDAALQSSSAISTVAREKPAHMHDLLVAASAYLLGAGKSSLLSGDKVHLSLGLPLAYYRSQRESIRERMLGFGTNLQINGGPERYISFGEVSVYPQGLGILLDLPALPQRGLIGLIDIGCFTTDYLIFDIRDGQAMPLAEACGSVEAGVHLVESALRASFQAMTGAALPPYMVQDAMDLASQDQPLRFQGKNISLTDAYRRSCRDVGRKIVEDVRSVWGRRSDYLGLCAVAGGGAVVFRDALCGAFPDMMVLDDPVFANADGFLRMACA